MRSIIRYEPLSAYTLRDTFNQVFNSFPRATAMWNAATQSSPPANLYEANDAYHVVVALPGVDPTAIDISIKEQVLKITGEFKLPMPEGVQPIWRGIGEGEFAYSFNLPAAVTPDQIEARYEHGLLLLNLPKVPAARPHKIEVKTGGVATNVVTLKN